MVLKVDIFQEGVLIPFIEYEVYNSETKVKLDLSACKDIKIEISIPVSINESELFKYDISSDYYNDICFSYQEKNKADTIINDRRNEYLNNSLSVCEENCEYGGYDYSNKRVLCECYTKIAFPIISEVEINKDKLLNNFKDIKSTININVIKCYKEVFNS